MNENPPNNEIPISPGEWVIDRNNPGQPGQYTGRFCQAGPHVMVQLSYPGGGASFRPLNPVNQGIRKIDIMFHRHKKYMKTNI